MKKKVLLKDIESLQLKLQETQREKQELTEELRNCKENLEKQKTETLKHRETGEFLGFSAYRFIYSLSLGELLSKVIFNLSEDAVLELTEDIFSITGKSKEVGENIKKILDEVSRGDKSLGKDLLRLKEVIQRVDSLLNRFQGIKSSYTEEMQNLVKLVQGVSSYTNEIADISEKTNILAINASIEAARVGERGKGFSVIAGEVQKLSQRTKKISEDIGRNLKETDRSFSDSFKKQSESIDEAVDFLAESWQALDGISGNISPHIQLLENSITQAEALSSNVTQRIERVTKCLQFQDKIRQILEHVLFIFKEAEKRVKEKASLLPDENRAQGVRREVDTLAEGCFTVKEEWEAVGKSIDSSIKETVSAENPSKFSTEDLKGDVTLF